MGGGALNWYLFPRPLPAYDIGGGGGGVVVVKVVALLLNGNDGVLCVPG